MKIMKNNYTVIKETGIKEFFDEEKFKISLRRSGASEDVINDVVREVEKIMFNGVATTTIFKKSFEILKRKQHPASLRYNLSAAIAEMGPDGFTFEKFIGEIFRAYNYNPVYVGKKIKGHCIEHEMDIVAFKDTEHLTAELKFRNSKNKKTDLKVILYMHSRFNDILNSGYYENNKPRQLIITNTKFTSNAIKYAKCVGIEILGWNYPFQKNLHDFILKSGIHPLTAITTINKKAQQDFIKKNIIACKDLLKNNSRALKENNFIPKSKIPAIEHEIKAVCMINIKK